jgi:hypothetical protein
LSCFCSSCTPCADIFLHRTRIHCPAKDCQGKTGLGWKPAELRSHSLGQLAQTLVSFCSQVEKTASLSFSRERSTAVLESTPVLIQLSSALKPGTSLSVDQPESIYGYKVSSLSPRQHTVGGEHSVRSPALGPQLPEMPRRTFSYNSACSLLPICELNVLLTPHLYC